MRNVRRSVKQSRSAVKNDRRMAESLQVEPQMRRAMTARLAIPHACRQPRIMTAQVERATGQSMRKGRLISVVRIPMTLITMVMESAAKAD